MTLIFAILPFFSTLLGGAAAIRLRHRLHPFMAFAAGVLVATALSDLLPEASDLIGPTANPAIAGGAAMVGFVLFSGLEALVHRASWEHAHSASDGDVPASASRPGLIGVVGPAGLIVHSTLDGLAIGLAFRASSEVGLLVGMAVLAHDFADGMNVVTLAFVGGRPLSGARVLLVLDALAPPVGVAIATVFALEGAVLGVLLAAFAGVFVAIGAGHLLPEAAHGPGASPHLVLLTALGAALVVTVRLLLG